MTTRCKQNSDDHDVYKFPSYNSQLAKIEKINIKKCK